MASSPRPCSSPRAHRSERRRAAAAWACLTLLVGGCGHAGEQDPPGASSATAPSAPAPPAAPATLSAGDALCIPATTGSLRARLRGAIEAEIDWAEGTPQCRAGVRPRGDGLRLLYKGSVPGTGPLLVVLGASPLRPGESARNVPVNLTIVREGTGQFYATQGEDKCAFDAVTQSPLPAEPGLFRLEGRGYCTQPARAVGGDGAVLLSRFDVVALVPAAPAPGNGVRPAAGSSP